MTQIKRSHVIVVRRPRRAEQHEETSKRSLVYSADLTARSILDAFLTKLLGKYLINTWEETDYLPAK